MEEHLLAKEKVGGSIPPNFQQINYGNCSSKWKSVCFASRRMKVRSLPISTTTWEL
jgi:hypothetical protein